MRAWLQIIIILTTDYTMDYYFSIKPLNFSIKYEKIVTNTNQNVSDPKPNSPKLTRYQDANDIKMEKSS